MSEAARSVACPVCKVKAGDPCKRSDDTTRPRIHQERAGYYWAASRLREELRKS